MSSYYEGLLALLGINILLGLSVYAPLATGQLSLGNAGFMAVAAYAVSVLTVYAGVPLVAALPAGALLAGCLGILVGFPALRLRGIYLAIATLGFGEIVRNFFLTFGPTGGPMGMRGMSGATLPLIWGTVTTVLLAGIILTGTRVGLALDAVRDDDLVAELMGLPVTWIKVSAFGVGAAIAGLGGGLYAHYLYFIEPSAFGFLESIYMVLFVLLGGMQNLWGAVLGAAAFTFLPEILRPVKDWRGTFFGGAIVIMLIARPSGLLPREFLRFNIALLVGR
ncbi:MAG: branched-chain amino acid ABC transporter permease [Candidatus Rokubacteria bacterium]|nr:branched-chain amino acid ABC transporter permease [Candidatus Rokubacteria bacterium]